MNNPNLPPRGVPSLVVTATWVALVALYAAAAPSPHGEMIAAMAVVTMAAAGLTAWQDLWTEVRAVGLLALLGSALALNLYHRSGVIAIVLFVAGFICSLATGAAARRQRPARVHRRAVDVLDNPFRYRDLGRAIAQLAAAEAVWNGLGIEHGSARKAARWLRRNRGTLLVFPVGRSIAGLGRLTPITAGVFELQVFASARLWQAVFTLLAERAIVEYHASRIQLHVPIAPEYAAWRAAVEGLALTDETPEGIPGWGTLGSCRQYSLRAMEWNV